MDLKTRLERLGIHRGIVPSQLRVERSATKAGEPPLESLVDGTWVTSPRGRCFVAERFYPLDHRHGVLSLLDSLTTVTEAWAQLVGPESRPFDPLYATILDVETTGMAWGAGTYAFLVGLSFFRGQGFLLRQYFMPDYADEEALLELVAADLADCHHLITFNGRAFDWPILEARYILAQRTPPCRDVAHLDLLLWSRRLWRRNLPSCALAALERAVLDVTREGSDVPGFLIPELYQDYLRHGHTRPMQRVFYHNTMDLLSMAVLAARIGRALLSPVRREADPLCDYLSLGTFYERIGRLEAAISAYEMAAESDLQRQTALKRLSLLLKRLRRYDEAARIWKACLGSKEIYPYIELAKYWEHWAQDYAAARRIILEALAWLQAHHHLLPRSEYHRVTIDLEHRLKRVEKRIISNVGPQSSSN